jgi:hypothetical protein
MNGKRRVRGQRSQRVPEAQVGQRRRVDAVGERPQLLEGPFGLEADLDDRSPRGSVNASCSVAIVLSIAGASRMNGSQRGPAKTRVPSAPPPASPTAAVTVSPPGSVQVQRCSGATAENTQSMTTSLSSIGLNGVAASVSLRRPVVRRCGATRG